MRAARHMLDDLLNIEVNTIVKPGMTGRKMPAAGHAILDVFSNYDLWVCEHSGEINTAWRMFGTRHKETFLADVVRKGEQSKWWIVGDDGQLVTELDAGTIFDPDEPIDADTFDTLRRRARTAEELHRVMTTAGQPLEGGTAVMLQRIIRNCDELANILRAHGPTNTGKVAEPGAEPPSATLQRASPNGVASSGDAGLTAEEMVRVRKVWELGTETIVMQTVVQLDGDVVARIDEARTAVDRQALPRPARRERHHHARPLAQPGRHGRPHGERARRASLTILSLDDSRWRTRQSLCSRVS